MMLVVVFDLKNFNLPEFCGNSNQTVILLDVIDVNVQHVRIKFTLSIAEEFAGCIFDKHFE